MAVSFLMCGSRLIKSRSMLALSIVSIVDRQNLTFYRHSLKMDCSFNLSRWINFLT